MVFQLLFNTPKTSNKIFNKSVSVKFIMLRNITLIHVCYSKYALKSKIGEKLKFFRPSFVNTFTNTMVACSLLLETIILLYEVLIWCLDILYYQKTRTLASLKFRLNSTAKALNLRITQKNQASRYNIEFLDTPVREQLFQDRNTTNSV